MTRYLASAALILSAPSLATPVINVGPASVTEGGRLYFPVCATSTTTRTTYSQVYLETHSGTALPSKDYLYTKVKLSLKPSVQCVKGMVQTNDNSILDGSRTMRVQITVARYATIGTGEAEGTILDNEVAASATTPAPTPVPAPVDTASPSLEGAVAVSDGTDGSQALQPSWGSGAIPSSSAPDVVGAFRFICSGGQVLPDDPILYPGQPGKSHLHQFYGNESANAGSTYASLRMWGTSTCNRGVAIPGNRSAYWMPAVLDANGNPVKPDFVSIYYKRRPSSDPKCTAGNFQAEGNCLAIPNGLRFIFGWDPTGLTSVPTGEVYFNCQGPGAVPGAYPNLVIALQNCPVGAQLGAVATAPTCWDGKNLDSADHRSHVGYAGYGDWGYLRCDSAHPYVIPEFKLGAWFRVPVGGLRLSCDMMIPDKPSGTCWHADYWEAWNPRVKLMWTDGCINKMLNCSGGDTGTGEQLIGAQ
jgi:hypothetical protein